VGLGVYFVTKKSHKNAYTPFSAQFMTATDMKGAESLLKENFYWAGPFTGYQTELRRTNKGNVYVRYLPNGARLGENCKQCLVVATYPFTSAVVGLTKQAKQNNEKVIHINHSVILVDRASPTNVYMAFPGYPNVQVEISAATARQALNLAKSTKVRLAQ
jgi:hypothetical protein